MILPQKNDPLTPAEMREAVEEFHKLFSVVREVMPDSSSIEDTLKVMETVGKLAHKRRGDKIKKQHDERFGFVKTEETKEETE